MVRRALPWRLVACARLGRPSGPQRLSTPRPGRCARRRCSPPAWRRAAPRPARALDPGARRTTPARGSLAGSSRWSAPCASCRGKRSARRGARHRAPNLSSAMTISPPSARCRRRRGDRGRGLVWILPVRAAVAHARAGVRAGPCHFDDVVASEVRERVCRARADDGARALGGALGAGGGGAAHHRGAPPRRRAARAGSERAAVAALTETQSSVEQRFADWGTHLTTLQQCLASEPRADRSAPAAARRRDRGDDRAEEPSAFENSLDDHRARVARMREELDRAVQRLRRRGSAELEATPPSDGARSTRSPSGCGGASRRAAGADRARTERGEPTGRRPAARRRAPPARAGAPDRHPRDAARGRGGRHQFDETIRKGREDAARRLARELELSVERFARQAEGAIAERIDAELRTVDARIAELTRPLDSLSART